MIKRIFDIVVSAIALLVLSPVLLLTASIVRLKLGGPVIFRQERPGYNGKIFQILKFRSMTSSRDAEGQLLSDEHRLTSFGKSLRATSLDELPALFNVLKGDMSLVGPRPLLVSYLPLYSKEQNRRHWVKPGITGWAQVNGRNSITWQEKFALDVWYVDNQNLILDLRILVLTVKKVFVKEGINEAGSVSMTGFKGNGPESKHE